MASLAETFVTKSYAKGKTRMMKKKAGEYDRIWRPKSKSSEGPKKSVKRNPYKDTWRPKSKSSEGPKKTMPRKTAAKKTMPKRGMR